ncbi:LETM1 family protein [Babesia ovis]|uniref:LETM1 family protein n=1 Tax=Babesia ovis TaxID=5869 RepID=A0A9W5TDW4_BABOV|nr:LETM1 family protein [Babesia ovis]
MWKTLARLDKLGGSVASKGQRCSWHVSREVDLPGGIRHLLGVYGTGNCSIAGISGCSGSRGTSEILKTNNTSGIGKTPVNLGDHCTREVEVDIGSGNATMWKSLNNSGIGIPCRSWSYMGHMMGQAISKDTRVGTMRYLSTMNRLPFNCGVWNAVGGGGTWNVVKNERWLLNTNRKFVQIGKYNGYEHKCKLEHIPTMGMGNTKRYIFGTRKDGNTGYGYGKNMDLANVNKGWPMTRGVMNISFKLVKWAVVMPFRLGKWSLKIVSLIFKAIGHIMRVCGRAVVVARVGGVSGIVKSIMDGIKHTIHWCKTGFRLYFANVKVSYYILLKRLKGHPMRYNERKLLMNTLNDALKLVPFSFFLIVPFAELLLPVVIRLFPQMLPSTFRTDNSKSDDYLQKKLLAKKELAQFFQELVQQRTNQILQDELDSSLKTKMEALKNFQERILNKDDKDVNPFLSSNELLVFAKIFKKEFKLDQMNLETLKVMCKLLGITPFSVRSHVVLQLRHHLLKIQREDRLIMWEGVESLSTEELQEACRDRAMKFYNISREQLQQQLQQWLDLSSMPEISPILLLWSRCITMTHEPMAIEADDDSVPNNVDTPILQDHQDVVGLEAYDSKHAKVGEKFAEEVETAQKVCSNRMMKALTAEAEVDAQKLVYNEERLEELSQKAKELKDIIEGNVKPPLGEEVVGSTILDDLVSSDKLELPNTEEMMVHFDHDDHVIRHTKEINQLFALGKKEILMRHEVLLSALHLQSLITDLQHNQLTEMFNFLLKVSEDPKAMSESEIKESVDELVAAARVEMEKIEQLTSQFDRHNLSY